MRKKIFSLRTVVVIHHPVPQNVREYACEREKIDGENTEKMPTFYHQCGPAVHEYEYSPA